MGPLLIPLIGAGLATAGSLGGAIGSGANRRNARNTKNAYYDYADSTLMSQYYQDPLTLAGNRSLLKAADRNYEKNAEAIDNQMAAGGATLENRLAARQANNESRDKLYGQLLMNDQARRDRISSQRLSLAGQRANDEANSYLQAAQDWGQWGSQMASAGMSLLSSGLLGGTGDAVGAAAGAREPLLEQVTNPISLPTTVPQALGGLKGAHYENGRWVKD